MKRFIWMALLAGAALVAWRAGAIAARAAMFEPYAFGGIVAAVGLVGAVVGVAFSDGGHGVRDLLLAGCGFTVVAWFAAALVNVRFDRAPAVTWSGLAVGFATSPRGAEILVEIDDRRGAVPRARAPGCVEENQFVTLEVRPGALGSPWVESASCTSARH